MPAKIVPTPLALALSVANPDKWIASCNSTDEMFDSLDAAIKWLKMRLYRWGMCSPNVKPLWIRGTITRQGKVVKNIQITELLKSNAKD